VTRLVRRDRIKQKRLESLALKMTNQLCYGGNLEILQDGVVDESVDLVYLDDPLFNRQATYNVLLDGLLARSRVVSHPGTLLVTAKPDQADAGTEKQPTLWLGYRGNIYLQVL
jgi:hypothetical protein